MSVSIQTKAMSLAVGLACLIVAYAVAQPGQPGQPTTPPAQPGTPPQTVGIMSGQSQTMQPGARSELSEVDQFFASCLTNKNEGEVEIGKFAAERAQNPQVKQFAQQMVSDHQALVPKLRQLTGMQPQMDRTRTVEKTSFEAQANTSGQPATAMGTGQQPTGNSGVVGQPGRQAPSGREGQYGQEGRVATIPQAGQATNQSAVHQLIAIDKQIAENCQQNLREKLQQKRGAEFDECYIGSQIGAHAEMLSALEVLKNQTSGQLRQIVQDAEPKVKQHLQMAEQIAEQLKTANSTRQADATGRPTEVPRVPR